MTDPGRRPCRRLRRWATVLALGVAVALQPGCVTAPVVPDTQHQDALGRVMVLAIAQAPEVDLRGFAHGKGEGAARGAGTTFLACMGGGGGGCTGSMCGAALVLWLGVCTAASAVGGVVGAAQAPSAAEAQAAQAALHSGLEARAIQASLRDQLMAAALANGTPLQAGAMIETPGQDHRPLAAQGVDTVLEVGLTKVETEGPGINPPLTLRMQARARLVRASDNKVLLSADYRHEGERNTLAEWSADQAARLLGELQRGYAALGAVIHDNVFLLYPFPDRAPHSAGTLAASFGLAPIQPRTWGAVPDDSFIGKRLNWTTVEGLRPRLRWEGFPRPSDLATAPEAMGRVKRVRYDLVVAQEQHMAPAGVVYRREGLSDSAHTLEQALRPDTRYFWAVRARFELDGRERVTEWSSTHFAVREGWTAPSYWSYRFKTP